MKDILDKIGSYNIFNYLLPGIVFAVVVTKWTSYSLVQSDVVVGAFLYYFFGSVISRIGSLVVEPILQKIKFVSYSSYEDFVKASKNDSKIDVLLEVNNMYRTLISTFLCVAIMRLAELLGKRFDYVNEWLPTVGLCLLVVIYAFSYKKQSDYISKRVSISK